MDTSTVAGILLIALPLVFNAALPRWPHVSTTGRRAAPLKLTRV
jgi:hypothetical protein